MGEDSSGHTNIGCKEETVLERERREIWRRRLRTKLPNISISELQSELRDSSCEDQSSILEWVNDALSIADSIDDEHSSMDKAANSVRQRAGDLVGQFDEIKSLKNLQPENLKMVRDLRDSVEQLKCLNANHDVFKDELVGLALSGGGIRSASFNLGVLKSLHCLRWLLHVDYLSTVSGGGYIGTAWSVHCARDWSANCPRDKRGFPFADSDGGREHKRVKWIRAHGSYLNSGREVNSLTLAAAILKGIGLNILFVIPLVFLLLWILTFGCTGQCNPPNCTGPYQMLKNPIVTVFGLIICGLLLNGFRTIKKRRVPDEFQLSKFSVIVFLVFGSILACVAWWVPAPKAYMLAYGLVLGPLFFIEGWSLIAHFHKLRRLCFWVPEFGAWMIVAGGTFLILQQVVAIETIERYPFGYLLVLILGIIFLSKLVVNFVFMTIFSSTAGRFNPFEQRSFSVEYGDLLGMSLVCISIGAIPLIDQGLVALTNNKEALLGGISTSGIVSTAVGWAQRSKGNERSGWVALLLRFGVVTILAAALIGIYRLALSTQVDNGGFGVAEIFFVVGLIVAWVVAAAVSDINYMSMHRYYRNRLADAFLTEPAFEAVIDKMAQDGWDITDAAAAYLSSRPPNDVGKMIKRLTSNDEPPKKKVTLAKAMGALGDPAYDRFVELLGEHRWSFSLKDKEAIAYLSAHAGYDKRQREELIKALREPGKKKDENSEKTVTRKLHLAEAKRICSELGYPPAGVDLSGERRLAHIDIGRSGAPYHLQNTNVVLAGSRSEKYRIRYGDSFVFSPLFVGSEATKWAATRTTEKGITTISRHGEIPVATSMAISGAAIDPNTGATLSMPLRIVMTLLNVRLGYWFLNTTQCTQDWKRLVCESWPVLVLREMFAMMHENSVYVRLSDGGHFDNLGLYELVRRRCKKIIICDAAADPDFRFSDLARAVQRIRVDFGVKIDIDTSDLKPRKNRTSSKPFVCGKIKYPDKSDPSDWMEGDILLIKTALFTDLNAADVLGYANAHSAFPDETTADQFFSEDQFEAYRELGYQAAQTASAEVKWFKNNRGLRR